MIGRNIKGRKRKFNYNLSNPDNQSLAIVYDVSDKLEFHDITKCKKQRRKPILSRRECKIEGDETYIYLIIRKIHETLWTRCGLIGVCVNLGCFYSNVVISNLKKRNNASPTYFHNDMVTLHNAGVENFCTDPITSEYYSPLNNRYRLF